MTRTRYVPFTPAGSCLAHLAGLSEKYVWDALLDELKSLYPDKAALVKRGYTVEKWK